jgi:hypothetical protein
MNSNVECLTQRSIDPSDNPVGSPIRDMISNEIATQETNRFNQRPAEIFERTTGSGRRNTTPRNRCSAALYSRMRAYPLVIGVGLLRRVSVVVGSFA